MSSRSPGWVTNLIVSLIVLGSFLAGLWALSHLGAGQRIAIHFDLNGRPNGWAPARIAVFIMPAVAAGLWILRLVLPKMTPRGDNLERSSGAFDTIMIAIILFMALMQGLIIAPAAGYPVAVVAAVPAMIGVLFVVIGNVLPRLRWNFVVGVRTPWTLADERVWDKTHRFGGWVMVIAGLVLIIAAAIPPHAPKPALIAAVIGTMAVSIVAMSYWFWRQLQRA